MADIEHINNGDSGLSVRTKLNAAIDQANLVGGKETAVQHNLDATDAPTTSNDETEGYAPRSLWFDVSEHEVYRCMDATAAAAVWVKTTLTLDELGSAATAETGDFDPAGSAAAAVQSHEHAADPHDQYVQKVSGKGLSTEDYTTEEKDTLAALERKQLVEAIRKTATLDLDFAAGEYSVDDGEKLRTTDGSQILTVERASPKWVMGPNGKLREVPPDTLARAWKDGKCQGVLIEESRTNLLRWSEDFTQGVWQAGGGTVGVSDLRGVPSGVFTESTDATRHVLFQAFDPVAVDQLYTVSFSVDLSNMQDRFLVAYMASTPGGTTRSGIVINTSGEITNDFELGVIEVISHKIEKNQNLIDASITFRLTSNLSIPHFVLGTSLASNAGVAGSHEGSTSVSFSVCAPQLEQGSTPSSYIPTEDAPVTRARDSVFWVAGKEFNPENFTLLVGFEGTQPNTIKDATRSTGGSGSIRYQYSSSSASNDGGRNRWIVSNDSSSTGFSENDAESGKAYLSAISIGGGEAISVLDGEVVGQSEFYGSVDIGSLYVGSGVGTATVGASCSVFMYIPRALSEEELIALTTPDSEE